MIRRPAALLLAGLLPACWGVLAPGPGAQLCAAPAPDPERSGDAADRPAPSMPVETIEVRGRREEPLTLDPTAFATVLYAEDFAHRIVTLPELLRETAGVQMQSLGGEFATVSIRGSSAEQVIVYLDGVPLNRALGGGVNLADLPLSQVESIAVYRGFTPAGLPAASIGGAVMIRTRRGSVGQAASGYAQGGSFGSAETGASFAATRGRAAYTAGFDAAVSDGDFEFFDANGTPHDATDDGMARRGNNDFARRHLSGSVTFRPAERARLALSADVLRRDQGVPGKDALRRERARYAMSRGLLRTDLEVPGLFGGRLLLRGAADLTRFAEGFEDSDRGEDTDTRIGSFGQEIGFTLLASRRQALSFFVSHRAESADLRDRLRAAPDLGTARRRDLVATIEDQIVLASDRLVLNPSLRWETYDSRFRPGPGTVLLPSDLEIREQHASPRIGFRARLGDRLTLKGNAGRFFRVPDFIEMFGYTGSVRGNPDLRPERGRSFDVGLEMTLRRDDARLRIVRWEATVFETLAEDLIVFTGRPQLTVVAENFGHARIRGLETSLALALGPRLSASANTTFQRAVNESGNEATGLLIPGRPAREAGAGADLRLGRGRLFYLFTYVGRNYIDTFNTESIALPARYLHDLGYRLVLPRGLEATFEVKNIGDDLTYDVAGYPLPGRSFAARIAWHR